MCNNHGLNPDGVIGKNTLDDEEKWKMMKIMEIVDSKRTKTVHLKEPIKVLLLYATAFPSEEDDIKEFRNDRYNRGTAILNGLRDTFKRKIRHMSN